MLLGSIVVIAPGIIALIFLWIFFILFQSLAAGPDVGEHCSAGQARGNEVEASSSRADRRLSHPGKQGRPASLAAI